jgi:hypothetical protein
MVVELLLAIVALALFYVLALRAGFDASRVYPTQGDDVCWDLRQELE